MTTRTALQTARAGPPRLGRPGPAIEHTIRLYPAGVPRSRPIASGVRAVSAALVARGSAGR